MYQDSLRNQISVLHDCSTYTIEIKIIVNITIESNL